MNKYRYQQYMDIEDPSTWGEEYWSINEMFKTIYLNTFENLIPNGITLLKSLDKEKKDILDQVRDNEAKFMEKMKS